MEVAAGDAAARGVSLPMSSSSRKEWRVVSVQSHRNSANEGMERLNLGQCDERLIYEVQQQIEPADLDFCSIPVDGRLGSDILHQRFHAITKQREELLQMEIELRAKIIARSEVMQMQNNFDARIKEHANANVKLQDQLHGKEQKIHELERKAEVKERELHAIRLDNESAWAKEDLLMEQSQELQSYWRERGNSEAEKAHHIKQIHDLQEHIQDKELRFMELQEQNRIAQETILLKDEQLREAQSWMIRAQEMDALQSTANHSLQAELRERTEQFNQLWFGCQRQLGEMERLHLHVQQLQVELANVREKSGSNSDGSRVSQTGLKDVSDVGRSNGSQVNGNFMPLENSGSLQRENAESTSSFPSGGNTSMQAASDGQSTPSQDQCLQTEQNLLSIDANYVYEASMNGQVLHANYLDANISQGMEPVSVAPSPNEEGQVLESIDKSYPVDAQSQQSLQQISSQFHEALRLDSLENNNETKETNVNPAAYHTLEDKSLMIEQPNTMDDASSTIAPNHAVNFRETMVNTASDSVRTDAIVSTAQKSIHEVEKPVDSSLLDERSLVACIVRTIGSGGRIRISSTLPNRLGKMLAPLHWHDYKKKYGKLEDFVASHPELFVIGEDYIQLREGAQEIIAATAAVAKVTAAASCSYSALLPSVAVTPMAQPNRLKNASSLESTSATADKKIFNEFGASRTANIAADKPPQFLSTMQNKNLNGFSFDVGGGVSNIKILSKPKDQVELNGSETGSDPSVLLTVGNGTNSDRNDFSQSKGTSLGRPGASLIGKQRGRICFGLSYGNSASK
ncbi:hypothetical protein Adt_12580 [Abeliophyllum distichum]|uniref:DUF7725 domain-containing protein n=1 Tax=Abeliophyllum distichum TaxID=126358 RepID=A0ABD1URD9_9LAMI